MLLVKVSFYQKNISLKTGSWLQSCKMTGHEGASFDYTFTWSSARFKFRSYDVTLTHDSWLFVQALWYLCKMSKLDPWVPSVIVIRP